MRRTLIACALLSSLAFAGNTDQNTTFQLTGQPGCAITNTPSLTMNWNGFADVSGSFQVQFMCSNGLNYTFEVGQGQNADGTTRKAVNGSDAIRYRLYWDNAYTQEIGVSSGNTQTGTGNGSSQTRTIHARVLMSDNQAVPVGNYTDTVRIRITW